MTGAAAMLSADDRLDIVEVVGAVMLHLDRKDWDSVREALLPDVTTDYTSVFGGDPVTCSRDDLVRGWSLRMPGFNATQHTVTQVCVVGRGDAATTVSNLRAAHWVDGRVWAFGGSYHHTLRRTPDGWRVGSLRIVMTYEEGSRDVRAAALRRGAEASGTSTEEISLVGRSQSQVGT